MRGSRETNPQSVIRRSPRSSVKPGSQCSQMVVGSGENPQLYRRCSVLPRGKGEDFILSTRSRCRERSWGALNARGC